MKKPINIHKFLVPALILLLAFSSMTSLISIALAQDTGTKQTYAFIGAIPNPVGVDQEVLLHIGITHQLTSAELGWEGLTVSVIDPAGNEQTLGPYRTDSTGGTGGIFVPTMVGTYKLQTHFPEQINPARVVLAGIPVPEGTIMKESESDVLDLIVTEEPQEYYPAVSHPDQYWTRPIDAQFREWNTIAGNWLEPAIDYGMTAPTAHYNDGPETPHILWAKDLQMGGLAGGSMGNHAFECGDAYEGLFTGNVIVGGVLFYNHYKSGFPTQEVVAVDMHTGEELWSHPLMDSEGNVHRLSFAQVFYWDSYNYHAVFPYLWATSGSSWHAFDPFDGQWVYSMENVPSGKNLYGPKGEIYRYTVDIQNGWVTLWNSSRTVSDAGSWLRRGMGTVIDATGGIEWNKTLPDGLQGSLSETYYSNKIFFEERMIGTYKTSEAINIWSVNLKPGQEGELIFNITWNLPSANVTAIFGQTVSIEDEVFTIYVPELRQHWGFDLDTGEEIWGPTEPQRYLDYLSGLALRFSIYSGKLYSTSMSGTVYAYDVKTGDLAWSYDAVDDLAEILWANNWPVKSAFFTDGKLYLSHGEHSPIDPKPRGAPFVCLDAETGNEIWRIDGAFRGNDWGGQPIIGDSIIATMNSYDQQVYAISKGPSEIHVDGPDNSVPLGTEVLLTGTVMDVSPGTQEYERTARFPTGVPAIADEYMGEWMKYVYMQFSRPADATGVTVKLEAIDPNGNYQNLGTTTSDAYGNYGFAFDPEIEGTYTIIATFDGTASYYGSVQTTYVQVSAASASTPIEPDTETPETPDTETPDTETPDTETPATEAPLISTEVTIIAAVAVACVIGIAAFFALKKRK